MNKKIKMYYMPGHTFLKYGFKKLITRKNIIIPYITVDGSPILSSAIRTTYGYDLKGNPIKVEKYASNNQCLQTVQYEYDWLNRIVSRIEPDQQQGIAKTTRYTYSWAYNLAKEIISKNGDGILNHLDCFGRVITCQNTKGDGSEIEEFRYDANNNVIYTAGPYGVISYSYNDLDRLINATYQYKNCPQVIIGYGYDKVGNRTDMTRFLGGLGEHLLEMDYTYDFANRLTSATNSLFGTVDYTYDKASNRKTMTYPNKVAKITYDYDSKNRIINITYKDKNGATISLVNYDYYNNGNRASMSNELGTSNYEYDGLDQITKVITPRWGTHSYEYDDLGNRILYSSTELGIYGETVFIGSSEGKLFSLNRKTGTKGWEYIAKGTIHSTPAAGNGIVCFGCSDGYFYALNISDGSLKWKYYIGNSINSSPAISGTNVYPRLA